MKEFLVENEDFRYIDFKDSEITGIQLITPKKFNGVVYHYGKVKVDEDLENNEAKIKFSFTLVHAGDSDYTIDELLENTEFQDIMGRILLSIIRAKLENETLTENSIEFR